MAYTQAGRTASARDTRASFLTHLAEEKEASENDFSAMARRRDPRTTKKRDHRRRAESLAKKLGWQLVQIRCNRVTRLGA